MALLLTAGRYRDPAGPASLKKSAFRWLPASAASAKFVTRQQLPRRTSEVMGHQRVYDFQCCFLILKFLNELTANCCRELHIGGASAAIHAAKLTVVVIPAQGSAAAI
jgi:hypothetical protein